MKATKAARVAAVVAAALSMLALAVSPASATAKKGCPYPYVCFYLTATDYNNNHPTAMYKDFGRQSTGVGATGADRIVNTRNDDRVKLYGRTSKGESVTKCAPANGEQSFAGFEIVNALDIQDSPSTC